MSGNHRLLDHREMSFSGIECDLLVSTLLSLFLHPVHCHYPPSVSSSEIAQQDDGKCTPGCACIESVTVDCPFPESGTLMLLTSENGCARSAFYC